VKGLCGIQPDPENPGYKHFFIRPQFVKETDFAEATIDSPNGEIFSRWERKAGRISLRVIVPPNSTATVILPVAKPGDTAKPVRISAGEHTFEICF
jgi:alpha-L-rhamnosidase